MSQEFHAIYEHGVLRPTSPLALPEAAEVMGTLHEMRGKQLQSVPDPLLGLMGDEPDLLDQVVDDALNARATDPLRAKQ